MKSFIFCLLLALVAAEYSDVKKQSAINHLLHKVNEPLREEYKLLRKGAEEFSPDHKEAHFNDGGAAARKLDQEINDHRVLEKHHWFSLFNTRQREEALMLFEVLMHAEDFTTFGAAAAHYRELMNEGEFVYALYVAVIHSSLTNKVVLPPLYEVTPHMFTNSEVIQQAYSAKMTQTPGVFKMDFTGSQKNPEQRVAYFGEDIGLNVHHVTWHMDFPFWWQDSYGHHLDRKGELFYWVHHQLTARFDLERLSNNLEEVDELYWDRPIVEGFAPHTTYKYGGEFPSRPDNVHFEDVDGVAHIRDMMIMESRIRDAIAHGYVVKPDGSTVEIRNEHGIDVLGDIIESSTYSANAVYYGALHNLAHIVLGRQGDPHGKFNMPPGVMEHFETATRDPAFFRLHKYVDNIFKEHKNSLPPYTAEEIGFPGVSVDNVEVSPLETLFEDFEFDLTNAVDDSASIDEVSLKAKVSRLAHKAFSYDIDVSNNNGKDAVATVRVHLCPEYDYNHIPQSWESGRQFCVEMDKFWVNLHPGKNHVHRSSEQSSVTVPDIPSLAEMMKKTDAGESVGDGNHGCGIPNRLLLPKGKPEGMRFYFSVFVTGNDFVGSDPVNLSGAHAQCGVHGGKYPDTRAMGFPWDRHIEDDRIFINATNRKSIIVNVVHKE